MVTFSPCPVRVGQPLSLTTVVTDDGIPEPTGSVQEARRFAEFTGGAEALANLTDELILTQRQLRPPIRATVGKVNGLYFSWNKYRGPGQVKFNKPQVKVWEDTRTSANSPWGALFLAPEVPEDGAYYSTVTFDTPGTYVLWGRADDGGLYDDAYITVNVRQ
ncbi:MAG: hypothetical protein KDI29_05250 [Pseudomonadales bacterium]|nr:hypothetical protein [Pseudomonadales bacterium]